MSIERPKRFFFGGKDIFERTVGVVSVLVEIRFFEGVRSPLVLGLINLYNPSSLQIIILNGSKNT